MSKTRPCYINQTETKKTKSRHLKCSKIQITPTKAFFYPMFSRRQIFLFIFLSFSVLNLVPLSIAEYQYSYCISQSGKFTGNSTYQRNLNTLLSTLPSQATDENGYFFTSFIGDKSNRVGAMALCRGDVPDLQTCRTCINVTVNSLKEECNDNREAFGGSDYCTLFYANKMLNNTVTVEPQRNLISGTDVANFTEFSSELRALLGRLGGQAALGGPRLKFATGNTTGTGTGNGTVYALVQCTPDLSVKQCTDCLNLAFVEFPSCCIGQTGGRVLKPSCTFRYEAGRFFNQATLAENNNTNSLPPSSPPAPPPEYQFSYCIAESGNFTGNSTYQRNLHTLLSTLPSNFTHENGYFYTNFIGDNSDRVGAMALCRGDVPDLQTCRTCINVTVNSLKEECNDNKEAIGGSDYCTLFYANKMLNNTVTEQPDEGLISGIDVANFTEFSSALKALLARLQVQAASGTRLKFATGNTTGEGFNDTIYALVQCTPDLTEKQCTDCLNLVIGEFPSCCFDQDGGRVIKPSCTFRYENYKFFNKATLAKNNTNSPPSSPPGKRKNKKQTIIVVVVSAAASLLLLSTLIIIISRRRKLRKSVKRIDMDDFSMGDDASGESLQYDFRTISNATNNFSDANTLGKGGFGIVYRGLLPSGQEIAVKRLSKNSAQGDKEFKNEVMLVAKLQHRNLVRLLGFCLEKEESILIYEFVANSSLDNFLFDPVKRSDLNWETRFKIIGGIARGILYLHEDSRLRIIHRDLKASNVLLDEEMNPKISDFGTARLFVLDDETRGRTMRIVGTYGYMAPEYAMHGRFSVKSDVFSFGILLLEVVSGQRNNCYHNGEHVEDLSSFAWISWKEGRAADVIDPALTAGGSGSIRDMIRCIHIGLLCVQENESRRPTMASVDVMLSSSSITLPAPSEPAFFMHSRMQPEEPPKDDESISAGNMDPITNLYAR